MSSQLSLCDRLKLCPNNILYNTLANAKNDVNCVTFSDLLSEDIEKALELTYAVDPQWVADQYKSKGVNINGNLTILYGTPTYFPEHLDINHAYVDAPKYGTHHTKMGFYKYGNGDLRIVVSTANLKMHSWNNSNQQLWVSPRLPECTDNSPSYSGSFNFKGDLINYLQSYSENERLKEFYDAHLKNWIDIVQGANCSSIDVFFIASAPYTGMTHITGMQQALPYCPIDNPSQCEIIAQTSSISLMEGYPKNLLDYFTRALGCTRKNLRIMYPTKRQASRAPGKGCLYYPPSIYNKQHYLNEFLCVWSSEHLNRTQYMSHVKSYCCIEKDTIKWYLLTSANLTRAAWGWPEFEKYVSPAYEAGVLFVDPKNIPLMYDLPLVRYSETDTPFLRSGEVD